MAGMIKDGCMRNPSKCHLLLSGLGIVKAGSRNTDLVQNLDYAQTFLEIAITHNQKICARLIFSPLLKGKTQKTGERKYTTIITSIPVSI